MSSVLRWGRRPNIMLFGNDQIAFKFPLPGPNLHPPSDTLLTARTQIPQATCVPACQSAADILGRAA